jgi:hypothetical protein
MLLEDSDDSNRAVRSSSAHFRVEERFERASYAERYCVLCERLMEQNLYRAASLMLSPASETGRSGYHRSLSPATSVENLFRNLAAHLLAASGG